MEYPKHISPDRKPAPTPKSVVENGEVKYGTFDAPFDNLNMLEARKPCKGMPDFFKKHRLVEWEAFEVYMDEGVLISAVYRLAALIGFSIFVWYDVKENKLYSWRNVVPKKRAKVASQLVDDYCYLKSKHSEYKIENSFNSGIAKARGYAENKTGKFEIDMQFERISPLANGVMPLKRNKNGALRNPLYTEKDFFKATGTITVNGKTYNSNENSVGIIDDHKGFYPFFAHYDWLTSMGQREIDGKMQHFAFNLTRNQSVDQHRFNENVIWREGISYPLPPVVFTHESGKKKAEIWHIKDETNLALVDVTFKIKKVFYLPIHLLFIDCYYALPFGTVHGYITDTEGKRYSVDGMIGIGEDKTTRM